MLEKIMPDSLLKKQYVEAGVEFGDAVSYIYLGKCVDFDKMFEKWKKLETEYSRRGYRTISLDAFIAYGGYGKPIENLGTKRKQDEAPILHAEIYEQKYLGKENELIEIEQIEIEESNAHDKTPNKLKKHFVYGRYELPTTERKKE